MKISDPNGIDISALSSAKAPAGVRPAAIGAPSIASDHIQLSRLGAQLSESSASGYAAKLSALTLAVSDGQYQVDAGAVGAAIIQHTLTLGRAA